MKKYFSFLFLLVCTLQTFAQYQPVTDKLTIGNVLITSTNGTLHLSGSINANLGASATHDDSYFITPAQLLSGTAGNAELLNGLSSPAFATAAQGGKADTALQASGGTLSGTTSVTGTLQASGGGAIIATSGTATSVAASAVQSGTLGSGVIVQTGPAGAITGAASQTNVIYASKAGVLLDGTIDNTTVLQNILNTGTTGQSIHLIIESGTCVYSRLKVFSNTEIELMPGAVMFQKAGSNWHGLTTGDVLDDGAGGIAYKNIDIHGGEWNLNCINQSKFEDNDSSMVSTKWWNFGFWIGWASNVHIHDLTIRNPKTFSILLMQSDSILIENVRVIIDWNGTTLIPWSWGINPPTNHDGIHFWGDVSNVYIHNFRTNGDDDTIAFNTNEHMMPNQDSSSTGPADIRRIGTPSFSGTNPNCRGKGSITNVTIDGVFCDNTASGIRFIGYPSGDSFNSVRTCDNIVIRNFYGHIYGFAMPFNDVNMGRLVIDNWHPDSVVITGSQAAEDPVDNTNGIYITNAQNLTLNNINPQTEVLVDLASGTCNGNWFTNKKLTVSADTSGTSGGGLTYAADTIKLAPGTYKYSGKFFTTSVSGTGGFIMGDIALSVTSYSSIYKIYDNGDWWTTTAPKKMGTAGGVNAAFNPVGGNTDSNVPSAYFECDGIFTITSSQNFAVGIARYNSDTQPAVLKAGSSISFTKLDP